jgi:hypothetical protein
MHNFHHLKAVKRQGICCVIFGNFSNHILHTKFVSTDTICNHMKFHVPRYNGSSIMTVKLNGEHRFCILHTAARPRKNKRLP